MLVAVGGDTDGLKPTRQYSDRDLLYASNFRPAIVREMKLHNELQTRLLAAASHSDQAKSAAKVLGAISFPAAMAFDGDDDY